MSEFVGIKMICVFGDGSELCYRPDRKNYVLVRPAADNVVLDVDNHTQAINAVQRLLLDELSNKKYADYLHTR